ncbi:MAG: hypothetical protein ACLT76_03080 [Clostridium fessum]
MDSQIGLLGVPASYFDFFCRGSYQCKQMQQSSLNCRQVGTEDMGTFYEYNTVTNMDDDQDETP